MNDDVTGASVTVLAKHFLQSHKGYRSDDSSQTNAFSDFIIYDEHMNTHEVHYIIISSHSGHFNRLCHGPFLESNTRSVAVKEDPPITIGLMIDFFYTFQYDTRQVMEDPERSVPMPGEVAPAPKPSYELELHAWMFTIADKYEVPDLKA